MGEIGNPSSRLPAPEGKLRLTIVNTYSVARAALGTFICNTLFSHPSHSSPAREARVSSVLETTGKAEEVKGVAGAPNKHPPMGSTVLSAKDSFTLVKPPDNSVK